MGGFGAMSYAARYPGHFRSAASYSGVLDPLGASLQDGPDLYFNLIRDMAASFRDCLSEAS